MRLLNSDDFDNILRGSMILGCGGGGDPDKARKYIEKLPVGKIRMVDLEELPKESRIFTVFTIGSSGSQEKTPDIIFEAKKELEKLVGKLDAVIPVEIGPGAVFETLNFASEFNLPVVDSDIVGGRSAPEIYLETITIAGINRTPMVIVNNNNDMVILKDISSYNDLEEISRAFASISGNTVYAVGYPMQVRDVKSFLVKRTLTKTMEFGDSVKNGLFMKVLEKYGGKEVFKGVIKNLDKEDKGGFLSGSVEVKGAQKFDRSNFRIWFKNENLIAWLDDKPLVTCPDSICILDISYNGIYNRDLEIGMEVLVVGIPAAPLWKSSEGIKLFNPRTFGFNMDYIPIENSRK